MKRRTFFGTALAALFSGKLVEKLSDPHRFPPRYVVGVDPCYVDPGDEVLNKRYKEWGEAARDMMADALFRETIR